MRRLVFLGGLFGRVFVDEDVRRYLSSSSVQKGRSIRLSITIVKQQLTREIAEGRFTGNHDAVRREVSRRVKERMLMSRGNNHTRLTTTT